MKVGINKVVETYKIGRSLSVVSEIDSSVSLLPVTVVRVTVTTKTVIVVTVVLSYHRLPSPEYL